MLAGQNGASNGRRNVSDASVLLRCRAARVSNMSGDIRGSAETLRTLLSVIAILVLAYGSELTHWASG